LQGCVKKREGEIHKKTTKKKRKKNHTKKKNHKKKNQKKKKKKKKTHLKQKKKKNQAKECNSAEENEKLLDPRFGGTESQDRPSGNSVKIEEKGKKEDISQVAGSRCNLTRLIFNSKYRINKDTPREIRFHYGTGGEMGKDNGPREN